MLRHLRQIVPYLAATLLVVLFCVAGVWQLGRARQKDRMQAAFAARAKEAPLHVTAASPWLDAGTPPASLRFRHVWVRGRYDARHQLLLDNRTHDGVAGYHVYTPLLLDNGKRAILVNRGWVPLGLDRSHLPAIGVAAAERVVRGVLEKPIRNAFLLGPPGYAGDAWPRVVEKLDPALATRALGYRVAPLVLLLSPRAPDGYLRHWVPYLGITPTRHRAYAFQWFTMALAVIIIVVVVRRRQRQAASDGASTDTL